MKASMHGQSRVPAIVVAFFMVGVLVVSAPAFGAEIPDPGGAADLPTETTLEYPPLPVLDTHRIYGGSDAQNPGWITALFRNGSFICTASLIDPQAVLTAAHCVDSPGTYSVRIGVEYLYGGGVTRNVSGVYIHAGWHGNFNDTDLAVLALDSPVTTLPVATLNATGEWPELAQVQLVAGWGQYNEGSPPAPFLQAAAVYATSGMDGRFDPNWCDLDPAAMTVGGMFCFGGPTDPDVNVCSGDSGGPVFGWPTPSASSGDFTIYGVVSYSPAFCGPTPWDSKAQSVGGHHAWISSVVDCIKDPDIAAGTGSVVVYDPVGGGVSVVDVNGSGDGFTCPSASGTVGGADTVGTAYLGGPEPGVDDVLFYSSVTGRFQFGSVSVPDGSGHRDLDVFVDVTGTRGWSHVITGDYNGDGTGDVLFYRASDGLLRFYTTTASGRFIPLTPAYFGTRGWTHLVVGDYNRDGSDDVMWYRARDGLLRFYEVTDAGEFRAITPAYFGTRNWTTIPAGDYNGDGSDDVLFYRGDGLARFYEVDASGTFRALGAAFSPSSGFTEIESVEFTPGTAGVDLAWYHAGSDVLAATRYNTNNVVNLWAPRSTTVYGDNLTIATGGFPR